MAARIMFCIEGLNEYQYASRVWNLAELGAAPRGKAIRFRATTCNRFSPDIELPYETSARDAEHLAILRHAIAEEADPRSTACFIILLEDKLTHPVFHAERVTGPEIQASFDESWALLMPSIAKAA
jgi:hypothetical protein